MLELDYGAVECKYEYEGDLITIRNDPELQLALQLHEETQSHSSPRASYLRLFLTKVNHNNEFESKSTRPPNGTSSEPMSPQLETIPAPFGLSPMTERIQPSNFPRLKPFQIFFF